MLLAHRDRLWQLLATTARLEYVIMCQKLFASPASRTAAAAAWPPGRACEGRAPLPCTPSERVLRSVDTFEGSGVDRFVAMLTDDAC
jgi:hypothetical protein